MREIAALPTPVVYSYDRTPVFVLCQWCKSQGPILEWSHVPGCVWERATLAMAGKLRHVRSFIVDGKKP